MSPSPPREIRTIELLGVTGVILADAVSPSFSKPHDNAAAFIPDKAQAVFAVVTFVRRTLAVIVLRL